MIDHSEIVVKSGDGGSGAISFRRESFVPLGGPDGGDGGKGGDVILAADPTVSNLRQFQRKRFYKAGSGLRGMGSKKHGKDGEDLMLRVPVGTVVSERPGTGELIPLADLAQPGDQAEVARGGMGGRGNTRFKSSTNQAPRLAEKGEPGVEKTLVLEMRLIADVGIIGFPNAGKSTLLTAATAARPKIAEYPFTTLEPVLGVVEVANETFVLAEIPGLIEGAHLGKGLGHEFLRHALRTRALINLIDGTSLNPVEDMKQVNTELSLFDASLAKKPQIVAVNKIDLPEVQARMEALGEAFRNAGVSKIFFISAATREDVPRLMLEVLRVLQQVPVAAKVEAPPKVFHPQPRESRVRVRREGDTFVVSAPGLERLMAAPDVLAAEMRAQLKQRFVRLGVTRALEKAGIRPGNKVRCGTIEFEW